jgi:hypothetical protein
MFQMDYFAAITQCANGIASQFFSADGETSINRLDIGLVFSQASFPKLH